MSKVIKVYGWRNIHTDEWYIGQTSQLLKVRVGKDGDQYIRHCSKFGKAIKEYGWSSFEENILRLCTSQEEADYWEKYYIKEKDSVNHGYNSFGGGRSGFEVNDGFREKQRELNSGENNHFYGRTHTEETKRIISEKNSNPTDETRLKKSNSHKGKPSPRKGTGSRVQQFTLDGQFVDEYLNACDASQQTGISRSKIYKCLYGQCETAGESIWRYV